MHWYIMSAHSSREEITNKVINALYMFSKLVSQIIQALPSAMHFNEFIKDMIEMEEIKEEKKENIMTPYLRITDAIIVLNIAISHLAFEERHP